MYPSDYRYTKEHEWVRLEGGTATVGITDYAQHSLGDVVYLDLPRVGTTLTAGKSLGTVESVKAVSEIFAPVSGEVIEVNAAQLGASPELINTDPHRAGWLVKLKVANASEIDGLMDSAKYQAYIAEQEKEASA
jgi:glycine cleavage system H protein